LPFVGASFAKSDDSEIRDGTIQTENQVEADFPALAKITRNQAVLGTIIASGFARVTRLSKNFENKESAWRLRGRST
jgi:hypothetical protein